MNNRAMLSEDYTITCTRTVLFGICLPIYTTRLFHIYSGSFRVCVHRKL